jgi:hypothetical protein
LAGKELAGVELKPNRFKGIRVKGYFHYTTFYGSCKVLTSKCFKIGVYWLLLTKLRQGSFGQLL